MSRNDRYKPRFFTPLEGAVPRRYFADRGELHSGLADCISSACVAKSPRAKTRVEGGFHLIEGKTAGGTR